MSAYQNAIAALQRPERLAGEHDVARKYIKENATLEEITNYENRLRVANAWIFHLVFRMVFLAVCAAVYGSFTPGLGTTTTPLAGACLLALTSARSTGSFPIGHGDRKWSVFWLPRSCDNKNFC